MTENVDKLLLTQTEQLQKLKEIVLEAIEEERLISEKLYQFENKQPGFSSKLADKIALFGGSWKFILSFALLMITWIAINAFFLSKPFDQYPFILLNLLLSTIAALQAPIIMMSQNRKEEKDRERAINDYMINLKAEIEVRNMHQKLDLLIAEQMKTMFEIQNVQLEMMRDIKESISLKNTIESTPQP